MFVLYLLCRQFRINCHGRSDVLTLYTWVRLPPTPPVHQYNRSLFKRVQRGGQAHQLHQFTNITGFCLNEFKEAGKPTNSTNLLTRISYLRFLERVFVYLIITPCFGVFLWCVKCPKTADKPTNSIPFKTFKCFHVCLCLNMDFL